MEGAPEHIWVQDEKGDSLRADICDVCILELNIFDTNIIISTQVEYCASGLHSVILTGTSRESALHENPKRV